MFNQKQRKFNFRCQDCKTVYSATFEEQNDIDDAIDSKLFLECPCGGKAKPLRD